MVDRRVVGRAHCGAVKKVCWSRFRAAGVRLPERVRDGVHDVQVEQTETVSSTRNPMTTAATGTSLRGSILRRVTFSTRRRPGGRRRAAAAAAGSGCPTKMLNSANRNSRSSQSRLAAACPARRALPTDGPASVVLARRAAEEVDDPADRGRAEDRTQARDDGGRDVARQLRAPPDRANGFARSCRASAGLDADQRDLLPVRATRAPGVTVGVTVPSRTYRRSWTGCPRGSAVRRRTRPGVDRLAVHGRR